MLTHRKLFSMLLMMAVLLILFMFIWVYQDSVNDYDINEYAERSVIGISKPQNGEEGERHTAQDTLISNPALRDTVFIGERESDMGGVVEQWCLYAGRSFRCYATLAEYFSVPDENAKVICVAPESLSFPADELLLDELALRDIVVIFGELPASEVVESIPSLRELLGVEGVSSYRTALKGIYLYKGFLLGGEKLYMDGEGDAEWELDVSISWYHLGDRTDVYMAGIAEEEQSTRQKQWPPILWKNVEGNATVFAVNGNYLRDETGLGFLEGMMAKSDTYLLYPVVNAQNITVADYPGFTAENEEKLQAIYGASYRMILQNIIWPSLVSFSDQMGFRLTCFMTPQHLYLDGMEPDMGEELLYYLRQLKVRQGEMGWSAGSKDGLSVEEKWSRDNLFFGEAGSSYAYTAAYVPEQNRQEFEELAAKGAFPDLRTVTGADKEDAFLFSFVSENIVSQEITHRADQYNFRDDLRNRSLQTALGYTNILMELECVTWPETEDERWENYSKKVLGNITTWWKDYGGFEKTTLTESACRVRKLLAVDYENGRLGDEIILRLYNRQGDAYFLLRIHDKDVGAVNGGTFSRIEENAWLITAQEDEVKISLVNAW